MDQEIKDVDCTMEGGVIYSKYMHAKVYGLRSKHITV